MRNLYHRYRRIESPVRDVILAEVFVQFVQASFFIALLLYMQEQGYSDEEATGYFKYRFLGVLACAFPLGRFLRGRPIRPFFYIAGVGVPLTSLLVVHAVHTHDHDLLIGAQILWGLCFMCMTVTVLPYIMRNASKETQTAAISLSFSTWSFATIVSGVTISALRWIDRDLFTNQRLLEGFSWLGLLSLVFLWRIRTPEVVPPRRAERHAYDWPLIVKAMIPTCLIAIGAGLTIPFMPLFFANVHGFETRDVAVMSAAATIAVLICMILTPLVKDVFGYRRAITGTQLIAIGMLVALAS
ncbi:MAG: MFS transporter, partial [Planctomycetota bacterium]